MIYQDVYIGVGSNLGDRFTAIKFALDKIKFTSKTIRMSSLYESRAQGFTSQPQFINCVFEVTTSVNLWNMLGLIRKIESSCGRRRVFPNAPRILDLDILFWGKMQLALPVLTIPHTKILDRGFTLAPLLELRPDFKDPFNQVPLKDVYESLPSSQKPLKLSGPIHYP